MILRNLTNSPYEVDLADGGRIIVPAFGSADCTPSETFLSTLCPDFWAIEEKKKK